MYEYDDRYLSYLCIFLHGWGGARASHKESYAQVPLFVLRFRLGIFNFHPYLVSGST